MPPSAALGVQHVGVKVAARTDSVGGTSGE